MVVASAAKQARKRAVRSPGLLRRYAPRNERGEHPSPAIGAATPWAIGAATPWAIGATMLAAISDKFAVPPAEQAEIKALVDGTRSAIVVG
jgi:hypothetical protein